MDYLINHRVAGSGAKILAAVKNLGAHGNRVQYSAGLCGSRGRAGTHRQAIAPPKRVH